MSFLNMDNVEGHGVHLYSFDIRVPVAPSPDLGALAPTETSSCGDGGRLRSVQTPRKFHINRRYHQPNVALLPAGDVILQNLDFELLTGDSRFNQIPDR